MALPEFTDDELRRRVEACGRRDDEAHQEAKDNINRARRRIAYHQIRRRTLGLWGFFSPKALASGHRIVVYSTLEQASREGYLEGPACDIPALLDAERQRLDRLTGGDILCCTTIRVGPSDFPFLSRRDMRAVPELLDVDVWIDEEPLGRVGSWIRTKQECRRPNAIRLEDGVLRWSWSPAYCEPASLLLSHHARA